MRFHKFFASFAMSAIVTAALVVAAPTASAAAKYCYYDITVQSGQCFYRHQALQDYRAAQAGYDYIHVVNWVNFNTGGGVQIIGGATRCTLAIDNEGKKLPNLTTLRYLLPNGQAGETLDNSISSVKTYNTCVVQFFEGLNYTGAQSPWMGSTADTSVYDFYDRATSLDIT
ncbi:hypothetical protein Q5530_12340 [Saccharothrix sp. BKS2]|uniref:hypothetical protein n=1 Tax=Saccharothrix sp. BKS2 TaxID=3064400 RepID=UPI0039E91890